MALNPLESASVVNDNPCKQFNLSWETRLYGFAGCFIIGLVLSIVSVIMLGFGNVVGFALLYTVGNIISLISTGFLVGPWKQIKMMTDRVRLVAFIIFLVSMVATLFVACYTQVVISTIILLIIQFLALIWYSLSYVPFARRMVRSAFESVC